MCAALSTATSQKHFQLALRAKSCHSYVVRRHGLSRACRGACKFSACIRHRHCCFELLVYSPALKPAEPSVTQRAAKPACIENDGQRIEECCEWCNSLNKPMVSGWAYVHFTYYVLSML